MKLHWTDRSYRCFTLVSILVVLGGLALPTAGADEAREPRAYYVTSANSGRVLAVVTGDTIHVTLEDDGNHFWDLSLSGDGDSILREIDGTIGFSSYIDGSGSLVIVFGATWHFEAAAPGQATIEARYIRYGDGTVDDTFTTTVHVFPAGDDGDKPGPKPTPAKPFALLLPLDEIDDAIPGQQCIFPVTVVDEGSGAGADEPVTLSIDPLGQGADLLVAVEPKTIRPGEVAELVVVPLAAGKSNTNGGGKSPKTGDPADEEDGREFHVRLVAERAGVRREQPVEIEVHPGEDLLGGTAASYRDLFVPWLAQNHSELGIDAQTQWTGTIVRPQTLSVSYYLFLSDDWEMGVRWHVMIPPHDWAEIYLRRRDDLSSTYAWRIPSVAGELEPEITELPVEGLFR